MAKLRTAARPVRPCALLRAAARVPRKPSAARPFCSTASPRIWPSARAVNRDFHRAPPTSGRRATGLTPCDRTRAGCGHLTRIVPACPSRQRDAAARAAIARSRALGAGLAVRQRSARRAGADPPGAAAGRVAAGGHDRRRHADRAPADPLPRRKPNAKAACRRASRHSPICAMSAALLQRAGFALPVTDVDRVVVRYASAFA